MDSPPNLSRCRSVSWFQLPTFENHQMAALFHFFFFNHTVTFLSCSTQNMNPALNNEQEGPEPCAVHGVSR